MLEVGYRLATAKPLVVLAPAGELPFDLKNHRTIILPADPSELAEEEAEAKVAELMELTTKRVARDRGWAGLHPTATIEVDRRAGIDPCAITGSPCRNGRRGSSPSIAPS
jgi:hypothetical protein